MKIPADPPSAAELSSKQRRFIEAWLKAQSKLAVSSGVTIPARADKQWAPASVGQEQMWFHNRLAGAQPIYNEQVTVHYQGELNVDALRKSVSAFIQRHELWRTTFVFRDGALRQNIHPQMDIPIVFTDLSELPESKREGRAADIARKNVVAPFDLASGPLLRFRLVRLNPLHHRLYIGLHHMLFDGVSLHDIFLTELAALYRAYAGGAEPQLPPPVIQYGDYAEWHQQWVRTDKIAAQAEYWKSTLSGMRDLELPTDHPRTKQQGFKGSVERFLVPKATTHALREIGSGVNSTLFMVLAAILAAQVKLWSGADVIPMGSVTSGRKWAQTERVVGFFLNTVVFRIDGSNDPTFAQLVERVRDTVIATMEQDDLPFPTVVQQLQLPHDPSRHPLFQIMFSLQPPLPELEPGWGFSLMDVETGATKFDLHLEMEERADGVGARFIYNVDLFERNNIRRMAREWLRIASVVAENPNTPLSQLVLRGMDKVRHRMWSFLSRWQLVSARRLPASSWFASHTSHK